MFDGEQLDGDDGAVDGVFHGVSFLRLVGSHVGQPTFSHESSCRCCAASIVPIHSSMSAEICCGCCMMVFLFRGERPPERGMSDDLSVCGLGYQVETFSQP